MGAFLTRPGRSRVVAALAIATVLIVSACESATVTRINDVRTAASRPTLPLSTVATEAARARSAAMCAAGAATPSADPAEQYDQETSASVAELVGAAPLDPAITDAGARNGAAANQIWAGWQNDPNLIDAKWDDVAVGEYECPDGNLYSTTVLRDAPTMPASGMYSSAQYTTTQVQTLNGLQYGSAVNYQGVVVPLLLDLYLPPSTGSPRPLVILVHGGGFVGGNRADFAPTAREYARRGYVVASISYRLDPRVSSNPALLVSAATNAIDDGIESVRWLRANAPTYGIDATRIAGLGSSAGGAITQGMAMVADPTPGGPLAGVSREVNAAVSTGASLSSGIDLGLVTFEATDAPVMLFHYETDTVTGDSDEFAFLTCAGLRNAGSTCDFVVQAGVGHTVSVASTSANWASRIGPFLWHHLDL